jgi:hypothetical protein
MVIDPLYKNNWDMFILQFQFLLQVKESRGLEILNNVKESEGLEILNNLINW